MFSGSYKIQSIQEEGLREYVKNSPITKFTSEHRKIMNQTII